MLNFSLSYLVSRHLSLYYAISYKCVFNFLPVLSDKISYFVLQELWYF